MNDTNEMGTIERALMSAKIAVDEITDAVEVLVASGVAIGSTIEASRFAASNMLRQLADVVDSGLYDS